MAEVTPRPSPSHPPTSHNRCQTSHGRRPHQTLHPRQRRADRRCPRHPCRHRHGSLPIRRAGFEPWPRAWNNLRASRATELAEEFPGHVAAAWLGHTEEIANAHYRQVLPAHFDKATQKPTQNPTHSGTEMGEIQANSVVRPLRENEKAPEFPGLFVVCRNVKSRHTWRRGGSNPRPVIPQRWPLRA